MMFSCFVYKVYTYDMQNNLFESIQSESNVVSCLTAFYNCESSFEGEMCWTAIKETRGRAFICLHHLVSGKTQTYNHALELANGHINQCVFFFTLFKHLKILLLLRQLTGTAPLDQQVLCRPDARCQGFLRWPSVYFYSKGFLRWLKFFLFFPRHLSASACL